MLNTHDWREHARGRSALRPLRVEDEAAVLRRRIEQCRRLRRDVSDERMARELERVIQETEQRLKEVEGRS